MQGLCQNDCVSQLGGFTKGQCIYKNFPMLSNLLKLNGKLYKYIIISEEKKYFLSGDIKWSYFLDGHLKT